MGDSARYLRWADREANRRFFAGEWQAFNERAAALLMELGIIRQLPDFRAMVDTRFID